MAKKIIQHLWRKRAVYILSVLSVAVGVGFYASFFMGGNAHALSGVTLVDSDTTGPGLDGRDFTVFWTPGAQPTGFQYTKIFITTTTFNLTTGTIESATGCKGSPCQSMGFFSNYSANTNTVPQYIITDSAGAAWTTSSQYVAWVFVSTTDKAGAILVSSTPVSSTFDTITDINPPQIDHSSVHIASSSGAAVINAFVFDDQTTGANFANLADSGAEYFRLYYTSTTQPWLPANYVDAVNYAGSSLYSFTIPTSSVTSGLKYYLAAADRAGNTRLFCASPNAAATTTCQIFPFAVSVAAPGVRTVAGTITSGGSALANAWVFAGGFAGLAVQTAGDGSYTLTKLPNNDAFDFTADKIAYCRMMRSQTIGTANLTGIDMTLNSGECGFFSSGSGGGAGGTPTVMFSGPPDGMQNVPTSMQLRVGLNQPMDGVTINDSVAGDAGSNIYLTTDTGTTKIAGSVTWCTSNTWPGCSALSSMDSNTILFSPSSSLATSTFYTLVIGPNVRNQGGQSITGNLVGGGHKISFVTGGGTFNVASFGTSGQFMPPYVKSAAPAPGISVGGNTSIIVEFNQAMSSASMTNTNIKLFNITSGANTEVSLTNSNITLDSTEQRFVTISHSVLSAGDYEVRVLGGAANASGMSMRPPTNASDIAFKSSFTVSGLDNTAPTVYPMTASGTTGVAVNNVFNFGLNEQLSPSSVNNTNVTMYKGATAIGVVVKYDPGKNNVAVVPNSVLSPNTVYTLTLGSGITDLASNALPTTTYTYTTGNIDTVSPAFKEVRCDDYTCKFTFTEPMNHNSQVDANWVSSTLNHLNYTLTQGGGADKVVTSTALSYDAANFVITATGVGLTPSTMGGGNFTLVASVASGITDLSGNPMVATTISGPVDDSKQTFGSFGGGDMGMFAPPSTNFTGGTVGGAAFTPMGFGSFTADQFAMGQATMGFPFNPAAGQDANVFQVKFSSGVAVTAGDKVIITFPAGTDITNATLDTFSPFYSDFNQFGAGTVSGTVSVDTVSNKITVTLNVSGTTNASDGLTIDFRKITNPSVPKGQNTGGYTLGVQLTNNAGTTVKATKTSMPYFIMAGGSNHITINIVAGTNTSTPTSGANGTIFMHGGGPSGPMDKNVTLTNGAVSAVDGTSVTNISYTSLNDGCYFFGTEPFVTLNGTDYFGQMSPEPVCVNGSASTTKYLLLTSSSGGSGSVTTTIKFAGISNFNGADIDIFAGGPGKFVVKSLTGVTTTLAAGYNLKLPANGHWFIGIGPGMSKGASSVGSKPKALPGVAPAPIDVDVSGVGTASVNVSRSASTPLPPGVTFAAYATGSSTITFTFVTADKTVSGTVKDGSGNVISSAEVFLHRQGFGAPVFGTTDASGTFSMAVSDYGSYEIGASIGGMPPSFKQLEVRNNAGTAENYLDGKKITGSNPLSLTIKKAAYTISGKALDSNSNAIQYAPIIGTDASGNTTFGQTGSDGSYTLYADNGTWNLKAELPPDKTGDTCGTFSKTVTIAGDNQSSQNITPSTASCFTLSGTASVGSSNLANTPIFIEQWDSTNSRPAPGGMHRSTVTDSSGAYSASLPAGTYRVGTLDPTFGELSAIKTVSATTTQNIIIANTSTVTFVFTGANANMNGFIELKDSTDKTKRVTKQSTSLASSTVITATAGTVFNYFADVAGVGKFTGAVTAPAAGNNTTSTVNLGIVSSDYITVTGTVFDDVSTSSVMSGALVTFTNTNTGLVQTAVANASGTYSMNIKSGSYVVAANDSNHLSSQSSAAVSFTTTTAAYDFGGSSPDQSALPLANRTIEGTVKNSSGATTTEGYVWATNSAGTVVSVALDPATGHYSLPVTAGTWTVKVEAPNSDVTTKSGDVTISGSDSTGNNITLTSDTANVPTSTTGIMAANSGGSVNDTAASGIKVTAGGGVLDTGSSNVTLSLEKTYTAPDSNNLKPLANTTFEISAKEGNSTVKDLKGNAEVQLDYTSLLSSLPSGVSESDLKLVYYSKEKGDYVPVEGGFTVDADNNTITGQTNHFTDFMIAYVPPVVVVPAAAGSASVSGIAVPVAVSSKQTVPVATTKTTPVAVVYETTPGNQPVVSEVAVSNPTSAIGVSNMAATSYQPGALMKFEYQYQNGDKALRVKIVREMVDGKGKVVATASTNKKLKANELFVAKVKEAVSKKLPAGNYVERIKVYSTTNKLLEQNSFSIMVEKLKKKSLKK